MAASQGCLVAGGMYVDQKFEEALFSRQGKHRKVTSAVRQAHRRVEFAFSKGFDKAQNTYRVRGKVHSKVNPIRQPAGSPCSYEANKQTI